MQQRRPDLAAVVEAVGGLDGPEVEALRSAAGIDYVPEGGRHAEVAAAESRAFAALDAAGGSHANDYYFAVDCQDDFARDSDVEDMYESDAILAANGALLAVSARETGSLSEADFETLTHAWRSVDAEFGRTPVGDGPTPEEQSAIAALDLPAGHHSDAAVAHYESIWAGETTGFGKETLVKDLEENRQSRADLDARRIPPRSVIGTGYRGNTRKGAEVWLDKQRAEIEQALATRGRSESVNKSNVRSRLRDVITTTLGVDPENREAIKYLLNEAYWDMKPGDPAVVVALTLSPNP